MGDGISYHKDDEGNDVIQFGKRAIVLTGGDETVDIRVVAAWFVGGIIFSYVAAQIIIHVFNLS